MPLRRIIPSYPILAHWDKYSSRSTPLVLHTSPQRRAPRPLAESTLGEKALSARSLGSCVPGNGEWVLLLIHCVTLWRVTSPRLRLLIRLLAVIISMRWADQKQMAPDYPHPPSFSNPETYELPSSLGKCPLESAMTELDLSRWLRYCLDTVFFEN